MFIPDSAYMKPGPSWCVTRFHKSVQVVVESVHPVVVGKLIHASAEQYVRDMVLKA